MGIKDIDALAKNIKPFRQEICQSSTINTWNDSEVSSTGTVESRPADLQSGCQRQRQRRPDRAVYVPRGRRSQTTPRTAVTSDTADTIEVPQAQVPEKEGANIGSESVDSDTSVPVLKIVQTKETLDHCANSETLLEHQQEPKSPPNLNTDMPKTKCAGSKVESALKPNENENNEEQEFQRASKEINRRNRRIIKQTFDSDILEITEAPAVTSKQQLPPDAESNVQKVSNLPHFEVQKKACSTTITKRAEKPREKTAVNAESDDWESIFDDNGECLDPKLMTEITANVGKVTISKPKNDYKTYQEPVNLDEEEFPHVLEVSNFPTEFKTQDLMMIFVEYKDSGFDIKWVDDTHALVVFSSSKIAARALTSGHSFVKLKPLTQATAESRARAKKSALFLQPYRQRPETCAALARRLVTGALGVRLSTAREEREIERRVLKEAKERKLLAAKLRDEAWEN